MARQPSGHPAASSVAAHSTARIAPAPARSCRPRAAGLFPDHHSAVMKQRGAAGRRDRGTIGVVPNQTFFSRKNCKMFGSSTPTSLHRSSTSCRRPQRWTGTAPSGPRQIGRVRCPPRRGSPRATRSRSWRQTRWQGAMRSESPTRSSFRRCSRTRGGRRAATFREATARSSTSQSCERQTGGHTPGRTTSRCLRRNGSSTRSARGASGSWTPLCRRGRWAGWRPCLCWV